MGSLKWDLCNCKMSQKRLSGSSVWSVCNAKPLLGKREPFLCIQRAGDVMVGLLYLPRQSGTLLDHLGAKAGCYCGKPVVVGVELCTLG